MFTPRDPKHCVMMYMHGNAGNRVIGHRKHLARHVSSGSLDMNVIIFDYRYVLQHNEIPSFVLLRPILLSHEVALAIHQT